MNAISYNKKVSQNWMNIEEMGYSLIISSICGYKVMENDRVNMYRTMFTKKSSKSNKGKYFFCARWPRWGQYQYWHWHCQVHGLHDYNLIKMCWWQKAYHRMFYYTNWFVWLKWLPPSFTKLLQISYPALQSFMLTAKIVRPKFIENLTYLVLIIKNSFFFFRKQRCLFLLHWRKCIIICITWEFKHTLNECDNILYIKKCTNVVVLFYCLMN